MHSPYVQALHKWHDTVHGSTMYTECVKTAAVLQPDSGVSTPPGWIFRMQYVKKTTHKNDTHSFRIASDKSAIKAINNLNKTWIHVKRTNQMHQEPPWANQHGCSLRSSVNAEKHFIQRITQTLTVTEQLNDASRWKYICTCIRFLFLFTPDSLVSTSPPLGY